MEGVVGEPMINAERLWRLTRMPSSALVPFLGGFWVPL